MGITNNLRERLASHNDGPGGFTLAYRPWSLLISVNFPDGRSAVQFEKYLKANSGRAFAKGHFAPAN